MTQKSGFRLRLSLPGVFAVLAVLTTGAAIALWRAADGERGAAAPLRLRVATSDNGVFTPQVFEEWVRHPSTWHGWSPATIRLARSTDASGRDYPLVDDRLVAGTFVRIELVPPSQEWSRASLSLRTIDATESSVRLQVLDDSTARLRARGFEEPIIWELTRVANADRLEIWLETRTRSRWLRLLPAWLWMDSRLSPFAFSRSAGDGPKRPPAPDDLSPRAQPQRNR